MSASVTGGGQIMQAAGDMIVVQAGVTLHFRYGDEEFTRATGTAAGDWCPYPGLRAFGDGESGLFFGREALLDRMLHRLDGCLAEGRPLTVVAPSGAGKSSLLRAGLVPALKRGQFDGSRHWSQLLLTPTGDPLGALAAGLDRLTGDGTPGAAVRDGADGERLAGLVRERLGPAPGGRFLLVVDQLEELFTLCGDPAARRAFVDVLAGLTGGEDPVALAVYGLRADFYGECAAHPHLREALARHQVVVGPMTGAEVRRAVVRPAALGGLSLAPGLVDVILRDLRGTGPAPDDGAYGAGRLPLLAHALRATWLARRGDTLTVDGYRDAGGIDGAVAATAEEVYEGLGPAGRQVARQLFLGLVRVGDGGEVTRRRRTRTDLGLVTGVPEAVVEVAERFTGARLLTQGAGWRENPGPEPLPERDDASADGEPAGPGASAVTTVTTVTVEVTHEALLWAWPRLRRWIGTVREGAPVRQEVEEAAVVWERGGRRDSSVLLRGARLELARSWAAATASGDRAPLVAEFLAASERQRRRARLAGRAAVAAVTVLALLTSALAVLALDRRREALEQRDNAIFDRVSAEADRRRATDASLAAQLDLVAHRMRPTPALRTQLTTEAGAVLPVPLPGRADLGPPLDFGRAGRLVTGGPALRLWDTSDPDRPVAADGAATGSASPGAGTAGDGPGTGSGVAAVAHNRRGDLLATGHLDGVLRLLDVSGARHPVLLAARSAAPRGSGVVGVRFSPDGRTLAVVVSSVVQTAQTGAVRLWDVTDPRRPRPLATVVSVRGQGISSADFSADGAALAVCGGTGPGRGRRLLVRLWDVTEPARPVALGGDLGGHTGVVNRVAFSPAGAVLATAGSDYRVLVWDLADPRRPRLRGTLFHGSPVSSVVFSPDGRMLATGENTGGVTLWNAGAPDRTRWLLPTLRGHSTLVGGLDFDPTGRVLASGGADGRVQLWRLPPTLAVLPGGWAAGALARSADGGLAAVAGGPYVTLWDVSDPARLTPLGGLPRLPATVNALAFRTGPDGRRVLATGDSGGGVRLWDLTVPARPLALGGPLPGQTKPVSALAFDAAGHTLAAASMRLEGGYIGGLRAWDVTDPGRPAALGGELPGEEFPVRGMAPAASGDRIYTGDVFNAIRVWRTGRGSPPSLLAARSGGHVIVALAAHPRAPLLATGSGDGTVQFWDASGTGPPGALGGPLPAGGIVNSLGFAPGGRLLAVGNAIGQIRLWDTAEPARTTAYGLPLTGHNGEVAALSFGPGDGTLLSAGGDGTVRLWQTDPGRAVATLCRATRTAMTPAVWRELVSPVLPYDPPCG
ncbi:hypothetical protein NX801_03690 [Streptomyces sp. LP05-1]|uniref:Novel STAND NTPase 1 domain-containing protein n=1 Tax=Streptomyces pyxinae TaxID=2970734 RepID=A0ABT2CDS5_9ACTN|nr:AAA family ATPase [Streptomyces sp. LP05-1]MCS0634774.1 hypothetical protein [Streptomyces sp. LP05-1]